MEPVQDFNLNRRYISGLEPEMPVTSSSYGKEFAISFSVERRERYFTLSSSIVYRCLFSNYY